MQLSHKNSHFSHLEIDELMNIFITNKNFQNSTKLRK